MSVQDKISELRRMCFGAVSRITKLGGLGTSFFPWTRCVTGPLKGLESGGGQQMWQCLGLPQGIPSSMTRRKG